jgi:uncharacterized protein YndB with AHSA1/START domain
MSMGREFEIRREVELPGTPEQVWEAITVRSDAWMFPTGEVEPRVGGRAAHGSTVTVWDPPHVLAVRFEGEDGFVNALEHVIEARDGGTVVLRYVHSGVFVEDWDTLYDAASHHTDFYLHTLGQYLRHFAGRPVTYVGEAPNGINGPEASSDAGAFELLKRELGVADAAEGAQVTLALPGLEPQDAVVDYVAPNFLGLRTDDALYRLFGRNAWGVPVGVSGHLFGQDADAARVRAAWEDLLNGAFAAV